MQQDGGKERKMSAEYHPKVKFFITTRAELATEKVNKWLEENYDHIDVVSIKPFMSYTDIGDKGAYMIGCMIEYIEYEDLSRNEQASL